MSIKNIKYIKYILYFPIFILLLLIICSCNKKVIIYQLEPYETYYITNDSYYYPFQFGCNVKIDNFEIIEISTNLDSDVININYEFVEEKQNDKPLFINDIYFYGIIFDLSTEIDYTFEYFTVLINNYHKEKIELNTFVDYTKTEKNNDILPLSIPFIGEFVEVSEWVFLATTDMIITDIKVITSESNTENIFLNSIEFDDERILNAKERFYIDVDMKSYQYLKPIRISIQIEYISNDKKNIYYSDFSLIGNAIEIIASNNK